jgi:hypothetical protein
MDKSSIDDRLWELRMAAIRAYDEWITEKSIKSTQGKISGYNENDILMQPDAMQSMIEMLQYARKANDTMDDFGRSQLVKKEKEKEKKKDEDSDAVAEKILANFGRSVCTSVPEEEPITALDGAERNIERNKSKGGVSPAEKEFLNSVKTLGIFMKKHGIKEYFKCKIKQVGKKNIDEMLKEVDNIELDDEADRKKILLQINNIKEGKLFDFCDMKPHQCLVCPYYYKDFPEFWKMKKIREEERRSVEDE